MDKFKIGTSEMEASQIALGCMRIPELNKKEIETLIHTSLESGITLFDHADIYGGGQSETLFGACVDNSMREQMIIQSKCGIQPGVCYNFSKQYILDSVDGILKRLNMEYLDLLLLHRPDTLMDGEEVASAFDQLQSSGKVRGFGVSNQNSMQIELMNKYCNQTILVNQLQFSITHSGMIDSGIHANMNTPYSVDYDGNILEYCRLKDITIQSWSPFQSPYGVIVGNEKYPKTNQILERLSTKYEVSINAIVVAWISTHPAKIQTILGTTNVDRVREICAGSDFKLTREEWYELYLSTGKQLP